MDPDPGGHLIMDPADPVPEQWPQLLLNLTVIITGIFLMFIFTFQ
jgi:hypothetical protein